MAVARTHRPNWLTPRWRRITGVTKNHTPSVTRLPAMFDEALTKARSLNERRPPGELGRSIGLLNIAAPFRAESRMREHPRGRHRPPYSLPRRCARGAGRLPAARRLLTSPNPAQGQAPAP